MGDRMGDAMAISSQQRRASESGDTVRKVKQLTESQRWTSSANRCSTGEVVYQLGDERGDNETEANLTAVPPKP
jgi:hypothetical protein